VAVRRKSVFEVQRTVPLSRGDGREGQEGAGCRREGARVRRFVLQRPAGCGTRLAAGARGALEAIRELGRCSTVMHGVL